MVRSRTSWKSTAAATTVIDGRDDHGIDAVAITEGIPRLWLVQAKWSDQGRAGFSVADTLKLIEGLRLIDQREFVRFNSRFQRFAEQINSVMQDPQVKITLVVALMGTQGLSADVEQCLRDAQVEFNGYGPILEYEVCCAGDIWKIVRDDVAEPSIGLVAKMEKWIHLTEPFEAYYGTVPVGEVAQWYADHGDRLFARNIRKSLGLTQVNLSLVETLTQNAQSFWYFNNGITVLCDAIEPVYWSRTSRHGPVELRLQGATVVNGAQTVAATHEAMQADTEAFGNGYVGVRVISIAGCPDDFATEVTKATNTQNRVEARDFVALDPVQSQIREDFALSLQKTYVVKRGEMDPSPEAGCSVVHAATSLACAHRNAELAVRAKRDPDLLWESGSKGAYRLLFEKPPSAYRIWRSVLLLRGVGATLHDDQGTREGRAAAIAQHGDLLIVHLVFQHAGLFGIDDPDYEWEEVLERVPDLTAEVLAWLIHHVDHEFGSTSFISSTFGNPERCRTLVERVLSDLREGRVVPELPAAYRPAVPVKRRRSPNAVAILVDSARILDGTMLTFAIGTDREREALAAWLADDPRRAQATWVNERSEPLLWSADGRRYSPTGLVVHMWKLAEWEAAPVAVQGTARWSVPGEGSLVDLAYSVLNENDLQQR